MQVKVLFFGVLTEVTGTTSRVYSDVSSVSSLQVRLQDDFPEIVHYKYRISVNNEIINDDPSLADRDEVALLPPFAGG